MNNLLGLKNWLSLSEAARHASGLLKQSVSEGDILHLALNGRLVG